MSNDRSNGYIGLLPIIHTDDLPATAAWYRDVLGFVIDEDLTADDFIMLWATNADESSWSQLGLMSKDAPGMSAVGQVIGLSVVGIESIFATVKQRGAKILFEIEDRPWGCKEFGAEDPNGYHLYFRESGTDE